jgi:hypothetical protein
MSNHLAIATVTAALQQRLAQAAAASGVLNPFITTDRPDRRDTDKKKGVNLYLYQASPNPQYRNADLPGRRSDGSLAKKPQVVLDLLYLLTFHGDDKLLEPQRMLGAVVSALNARPLLTPTEIKDNVITPAAAVPDSDPRHFLGQSDLPGQVEQVRFTLLPQNTEELSRLWSLFDPTPYSLALIYRASVVINEPADMTPKPALPVLHPNLYVRPFAEPLVEKVYSTLGEGLPVVNGAVLVLEGQNLRGEVTHVVVGGVESTPPADQIAPKRIQLPLPAGLKAGLHGVQVVQKLLMGTPPVEHRGFESNVFGLVLQPLVVSAIKSAVIPGGGLFNFTLTVGAQPLLRQDQRVTLLLNRTSGSGDYAFSMPPLAADAATIPIKAVKVAAGEYFIRLQVDGAESPLVDLNPLSPTFGEMAGPRVVIP